MSDPQRPDCQQPQACVAKTPGKHCRRCGIVARNADPEFQARRRDGIAAFQAQPGVAEMLRQRIVDIAATKRRDDPAFVEQLREHGRRQYREILNTAEVRARNQAPEVRQQAGARRTETVLGWCPVELRADYDYLVRKQHIPAVEARKLIEERVPGTQAHAKRAVANEQFNGRLKHEREKEQAY